MRNTLFAFLLLLLSGAAQAQRFLTEVFPSVTKTSNVTYATNYSVLSGGPVSTNLTMDVYEPGGTDTMVHRPLIVFLHSGTFLPPYLNTQLEGGRNDSGIIYICQAFARRGYVVANIDYRLGWNPQGSNVDIRKGTLITAFVRAIQDVKAAVRYFRKDAATTNLFRIDSNRVIVGGEHTGGALAINYAALQNQSQLSIPKFISSITDPVYGFQAGLPYVNASVWGDLDGYGGNPAYNNPNNSPGYNSKANFIFSYEGIIGDSSWAVPGLPPIVAFHRVNNNDNQPFFNGMVYVFIPTPQPVVEVSGSGVYMPRHNQHGNNACFIPNTFTDPYTARAMVLSGGVEGLYPQLDSNAGISWFDSVTTVNTCLAYGLTLAQCNGIYTKYANINNKPRSLLYLDTLMGYLNPRIVKCMYPTPTPGAVAPQATQSDIQIFPNPSSGNITITTSGNGNGINSVAIKDITGKLLQEASGSKQHRLELHLKDLPAGMYLITVSTDKKMLSRKLMIE